MSTRRYEVAITSNAVVRHVYQVDANSPTEAVAKVRDGMVPAESEEVYGEQETDCEVRLLKAERKGAKTSSGTTGAKAP